MFDSRMRHFKARVETVKSWCAFSCTIFVPSDRNVTIAHAAKPPSKKRRRLAARKSRTGG
jgi:hypothetical protein